MREYKVVVEFDDLTNGHSNTVIVPVKAMGENSAEDEALEFLKNIGVNFDIIPFTVVEVN